MLCVDRNVPVFGKIEDGNASDKRVNTEVTLYGESYREVVIHSSAHDRRRQKRIERELLEEKPIYGKGRPRNDGFRKIKEMRYVVSSDISENTVAVSTFRKEAGCFVLITNVHRETEGEQIGYDSKAILEAYKDQYGIEQDFGFLKDPVIVNSVFLKKPKRIEVLGLILLTSLLIWRLMESSMRQYVEQTGEKLTGWDHKPTDRPTSFMITTKFMGIMVIKIGNERRLSKPLYSDRKAFLMALGINLSRLINPQSG